MIQNDQQRAITLGWIERFRESVDRLKDRLEEGDDNTRGLRRIEFAALRSEIDVLEAQPAEYEEPRAGKVQTFSFASFADLPKALVKARIVGGLTQAELARRLGFAEQMLARGEARDYESFNIARLLEVASIVGVKVSGHLVLAGGAKQSAA